MAQVAYPTSFTSATWSGVYTDLGDGSDATFVESPMGPIASQTFVCNLAAMTDPTVDTGHQIRVRAQIDPPGGGPLNLVLTLENVDDDSVVAVREYPSVPDAFVDSVLDLNTTEASAIHSYSGLRIRGYAYSVVGESVAFFWNTTPGATSYVLQITQTSGQYSPPSYYNSNVGYTLTHTLTLATPGTYYSRVVPYIGGTPQTPTAEEETTV